MIRICSFSGSSARRYLAALGKTNQHGTSLVSVASESSVRVEAELVMREKAKSHVVHGYYLHRGRETLPFASLGYLGIYWLDH